MANYKLLVPFILGWEGGEVNDKDDSGGYTNKGITYTTFKYLAKIVLGKEPTVNNFQNLTNDEAELFVKHFFMKATAKNTIKSQKIAESITTWFWGSAYVGIKQFQNLLNKKYQAGLTVNAIIDRKTTEFINSLDPDKLFIEMILARKSFFQDLVRMRPKDKKFITGWLNRLDAFYLKHKTANDPDLQIKLKK